MNEQSWSQLIPSKTRVIQCSFQKRSPGVWPTPWPLTLSALRFIFPSFLCGTERFLVFSENVADQRERGLRFPPVNASFLLASLICHHCCRPPQKIAAYDRRIQSVLRWSAFRAPIIQRTEVELLALAAGRTPPFRAQKTKITKVVRTFAATDSNQSPKIKSLSLGVTCCIQLTFSLLALVFLRARTPCARSRVRSSF